MHLPPDVRRQYATCLALGHTLHSPPFCTQSEDVSNLNLDEKVEAAWKNAWLCDHPLIWHRLLKICSKYEIEHKTKHRLDITNEEKSAKEYRELKLKELGLDGDKELKTKGKKPLKPMESISSKKNKEYDELFDDSSVPVEIKLKREQILQDSHGWLIMEKDISKLRKISPALAQNFIYEKDGWNRRHVMSRFEEEFFIYLARKKIRFADPESDEAIEALREYWRENYVAKIKRTGNPKMPIKFALDGVEQSIRFVTEKQCKTFLKGGKKLRRWHAERLGYSWEREKDNLPSLSVLFHRR